MLDDIKTNIQDIQDVVRRCTTESVVLRCVMEKGYPRPGLTSPARQMAFLLGVLLSTKEPDDGRGFTDGDWERTSSALERLFSIYVQRYSSSPEEYQVKTLSELRQEEISVLSFVDYFNKTTLVTGEQVRDHIHAYITPFDEVLCKDLGLSASNALLIVDEIIEGFKANLDIPKGGYGLPPTYAELSKYRISRSNLIAKHGTNADTFWNLFTVGRGEGSKLHYPTDQSIVDLKPLVRLSEDVAFGCNLQEMLLSVLGTCEALLLKRSAKRTYLKHRAKTLEDETVVFMRDILGPSTNILRNVYETSDNQKEHDIVAFNDDICLFIEVKSSPPDEPFRDPKKAYTRLSRSFRSDTGIQKAYEQANSLLSAVKNRDHVVLYDRQGNEAVKLPGSLRDRAFCVCVTRDNHGPPATCLSFMLKKNETEPFPWVVSVLNLESIAEAWQYYRWGSKQLKAFLKGREKLHSSAFSDDELDYVGAFILHCGLQAFVADVAIPFPINPTYSDIFDFIHNHMKRGGRAARFNPVYPIQNSIDEFLRSGESILSMSRRQKPIKLMRNMPCPCGSGVKSKRCHGAL